MKTVSCAILLALVFVGLGPSTAAADHCYATMGVVPKAGCIISERAPPPDGGYVPGTVNTVFDVVEMVCGKNYECIEFDGPTAEDLCRKYSICT